jgi:hypothetical protein
MPREIVINELYHSNFVSVLSSKMYSSMRFYIMFHKTITTISDKRAKQFNNEQFKRIYTI